MKKVILMFVIISVTVSCNESTNNKQANEAIEMSKLVEAKKTAKQIFEFVEQAETNQITRKELDKKARPLQAHLDSLRIILTQTELTELDDYRTNLVSEMVDRSLLRKKK